MRTKHSAFTLVELLVVITIIGILAALLLVAATGALKTAKKTAIKAEIDNLSQAIETYRNDVGGGSYPPNLMTAVSGNPWTGTRPAADNVYFNNSNTTVLNDFRRHMKKVSPRHREPEHLLDSIAGENEPNPPWDGQQLIGGMSAAEALVFWLGGFSSDPSYPLTGSGGPVYKMAASTDINGGLEGRSNIGIFEVSRMGPRDDNGNFAGRFLQWSDGTNTYRLNFWQYLPRNSVKPYVYFDASRQGPNDLNLSAYDPGETKVDQNAKDFVYPILQLSPSGKGEYANKDKFQILHSGIDDEWGDMRVMSAKLTSPLIYPTGPFTGEIADTIVNFSTSTLEDSQK